MSLRKWFMEQVVTIQRIGVVTAVIMLALNLSVDAYPHFRHVGGVFSRYYVGPLVVFLLILGIIWFISRVYTWKMDMYVAETEAQVTLNPYQIYRVGPFQEMSWRNQMIPMMKSMRLVLDRLEEKEAAAEMSKHIAKAENWVRLGFIPKEDFPPDLIHYYKIKDDFLLQKRVPGEGNGRADARSSASPESPGPSGVEGRTESALDRRQRGEDSASSQASGRPPT